MALSSYKGDPQHIERLRNLFVKDEDVELAVLIGSRAKGTSVDGSDWDIAIQWCKAMPIVEQFGHAESLRRRLAGTLGIDDTDIDLIDMPQARLAIRAVIAEEGIPLKGEDTLAWSHFLLRTWRELEDFYWNRQHAA
ncbi:MAG TPA: nucleotidyltransferase domain-containing protein [Methylococcaceae bacterium]|nr:nucleotidyltransferase domain-containing protein [Methylococcaceae bacterium]